ncbi:hypothetical protein HanXRQr2_Chr12g0545871 [Helianthus annuus]|uniref:Uncharacterized protein n=1 Tax=Helianthus annuus TaxID=4232 RepID=A0A251T2Q5_HELAN|nr:uncharacterized protein LOC110896792 isoform X3 [Helianthus annuus]KAF5778297.1 hypothetical protein HanXRQr2_Chr12g0545871 [Helianthus annuus]KAJ0863052.1 hypothetical protein HanPSC8_Chr12g0525481 [Helianthus annuus]
MLKPALPRSSKPVFRGSTLSLFVMGGMVCGDELLCSWFIDDQKSRAGASFALTSIVLEVVYLVVAQHQTEKTASDPSTVVVAQHQTEKTASDPSTDQRSIIAMC